MSKRAGIAVGVSIALLALAQAVVLFVLGSRVGVPLDPLGDPIIDNMRRHMAYNRGAFHLLGTLLAVPWFVALPSLAPLGRLPRLLFVPWAISTVSWLAWVAQRLPIPDRTAIVYGAAGVLSAAAVGLTALVVFAWRFARAPADRPAAGRGLALAVFVLVWTCAFAVAQVQIGISA
jgi:hypothetical protein